jgi:hypothetical protein
VLDCAILCSVSLTEATISLVITPTTRYRPVSSLRDQPLFVLIAVVNGEEEELLLTTDLTTGDWTPPRPGAD